MPIYQSINIIVIINLLIVVVTQRIFTHFYTAFFDVGYCHITHQSRPTPMLLVQIESCEVCIIEMCIAWPRPLVHQIFFRFWRDRCRSFHGSLIYLPVRGSVGQSGPPYFKARRFKVT